LTDANVQWDQFLIISDAFPRLDLAQRIATVRREIDGRIVFTTSFGIEDQAIADTIFTQEIGIEVVTLDTGRLFPETYELWSKTERRYRRRIHALYPDQQRLEALVARQGANGFRASVEARHACCATRRVVPLGRGLTGAAAWITGMRADQSPDRALISRASVDQQYQLIKVNPLFDWTRDRVVAYLHDRCIPYNPLHDRGFLSIGCEPCTRAVSLGEPERAGRWWWEQEEKKECGLHARQPALTRRSEPA
jgi:phosphoadenosine phosphosulfate reductase